MVERKFEELCVGGSSPSVATNLGLSYNGITLRLHRKNRSSTLRRSTIYVLAITSYNWFMEYIVDKWGKLRKAETFECAYCHKAVTKRTYTNIVNKFCSRECMSLARVKEKDVHCLNCGKLCKLPPCRISNRNFCSRTCKDSYSTGEKHPNWKGGGGSYRDRALRKYGARCSNPSCPITFKIPSNMLEVDHIDSDRENNHIDNLTILCTWCHRVKTLETNRIANIKRHGKA